MTFYSYIRIVQYGMITLSNAFCLTLASVQSFSIGHSASVGGFRWLGWHFIISVAIGSSIRSALSFVRFGARGFFVFGNRSEISNMVIQGLFTKLKLSSLD